MDSVVCSTMKLNKKYGQVYALRDVSITINKGEIYGLIGKNGAGKTTLMRVIAGLVFPTSGTIELFGCNNKQDLNKARCKTGFMIEAPSINLSMTAKENLLLYGILRGEVKQNHFDDLLKLVGLSDVGKKKARNFSLGMKQRLGIAIALIGNPQFLILDEPINGLDPVGVKEVRDLLIRLRNERDIAILLSSHNLPELYQVATQYIIIDRGEVKEELSLQELEKQCRQYLSIRSDQPQMVIDLLSTKLHVVDFISAPDSSLKFFDGIDKVDEIAKLLHEHGILVTTLSVQDESLENYFLSLIGGQLK